MKSLHSSMYQVCFQVHLLIHAHCKTDVPSFKLRKCVKKYWMRKKVQLNILNTKCVKCNTSEFKQRLQVAKFLNKHTQKSFQLSIYWN